MLFSLISMCGGNPQHNAYGFQHWKEGGLFRPYLVGGTTGKFLGTYNCLIWAGFAAGGPDVLALIAAEVKMPRKTLGLLLNVPISEYTCSILVVFFLELSYSF